jgi:hypothetical protein
LKIIQLIAPSFFAIIFEVGEEMDMGLFPDQVFRCCLGYRRGGMLATGDKTTVIARRPQADEAIQGRRTLNKRPLDRHGRFAASR